MNWPTSLNAMYGPFCWQLIGRRHLDTDFDRSGDFLQDAFEKGRSLSQYPPEAFPLRFIPDTAKRYLYTHDANGHRHVLPDRYEFLVYRLLRNGLEAGDIFCRDSVRFRSFEDDLLDDQRGRTRKP